MKSEGKSERRKELVEWDGEDGKSKMRWKVEGERSKTSVSQARGCIRNYGGFKKKGLEHRSKEFTVEAELRIRVRIHMMEHRSTQRRRTRINQNKRLRFYESVSK